MVLHLYFYCHCKPERTHVFIVNSETLEIVFISSKKDFLITHSGSHGFAERWEVDAEEFRAHFSYGGVAGPVEHHVDFKLEMEFAALGINVYYGYEDMEKTCKMFYKGVISQQDLDNIQWTLMGSARGRTPEHPVQPPLVQGEVIQATQAAAPPPPVSPVPSLHVGQLYSIEESDTESTTASGAASSSTAFVERLY